ncbi:MAG: 30S ribosomal protein S7 [Candidatus Peribacteria bacterium]|jgi:small subunit ribosomal protein S7|nr:30S ribosomal protein S7 [Candidatus Peribacteria bacterium]
MSKSTNAGIQQSNEEKLINHLMKNGKKSVAKKIYDSALKEIKKSGHMNPSVVVQAAIENASPNIMIKSKRIGGAVYQVPVEVKPAKRFFFATKWILDAARGKTGKPMYKKLAEELIAAYGNQGSAVKKKEEAHKMAEANKAFAYMAKYVN